jgi:hypothetical protein
MGTRVVIDPTVKHAGTWPTPRSGHALVYLQPKLAERFGCAKGALLMYGGSDIKALSINALWFDDSSNNATGTDQGTDQNARKVKRDPVRDATWDRRLWLYDVAAKRWSSIQTMGSPPPLMYHAMTIADSQVRLLLRTCD